MTHPTNLEYLAKSKIRTIRAEGLRSQQLKRHGPFIGAGRNRGRLLRPNERRGGRLVSAAKRTLWAAAGFAALVMAAYLLF